MKLLTVSQPDCLIGYVPSFLVNRTLSLGHQLYLPRAQGLVITLPGHACTFLHLAVRRKNGVSNKRCKQATNMGIAQNTQGNIYILTSLPRRQYTMAFVAT